MNQLEGVRVCVFDAYGTLFDLASAAARCEEVALDRRAALSALWRDKQVQYSWLRSLRSTSRSTASASRRPPCAIG
jgi:2-haloacid dehalogenase